MAVWQAFFKKVVGDNTGPGDREAVRKAVQKIQDMSGLLGRDKATMEKDQH